MARAFGRILSSIWDDDDFLNLDPEAQRLYMFLVSQKNLNHAGLLPLTVRKWATKARTLTVDQVYRSLADLDAAGFLVVDYETEEVLVRAFIRRDDVYKQPRVMGAAVSGALEIDSRRLRKALSVEMGRLPLDELSDEPTRLRNGTEAPSIREQVLGHIGTMLKAFSEPGRPSSPPPSGGGSPGPSGGGSAPPSATPSGRPSGGASATPSSAQSAPRSPETQNSLVGALREGGPEGGNEGGPEGLRGTRAPARDPLPLPLPLQPRTPLTSPTAPPRVDPNSNRPDVDALCNRLAELIIANGSKPPTITKAWRDAARLLLDKDRREHDKAMRLIEWCQASAFWRANVLSMPTFREKYDQLRLQANEQWEKTHHGAVVLPFQRAATTDLRVAEVDAAVAAVEAEIYGSAGA